MTRLYTPQALHTGGVITLSPESSHHLLTVLRAAIGAEVVLFNGDGNAYTATLTQASKKLATLHISACVIQTPAPTLQLTVLHALAQGERMDYAVQKTTELGVSHIVIFPSARSQLRLTGERLDKKLAHWQQVAISACEQCGYNWVPRVSYVSDYTQALAQARTPDEVALILDPEAPHAVAQLPASPAYRVLIGPEGGFTAAEVQQAQAAGYGGVRLGPRILRCETAGVVALAALQTVFGDFR